jgi:biotin carboxyl carrier protein
VGSELSGTIEAVFVDYNDRVKKGQVLARLDLAKLQDAIAKAKAALASADAKVLQTVATVKEARANLKRLRQVAKLSGGKVPSPAELETAEATQQRAIADEASARAAVDEARATLRSSETDLTKASIRSPIDGVVLKRSVEPGPRPWPPRCKRRCCSPSPKIWRKWNCRWTWTRPMSARYTKGKRPPLPWTPIPTGNFRPHQPGAIRFGNGGQRGQLQDHPQREQRRSQSASRHDRHRRNRHRRAGKRVAGPERGAAVHAAEAGGQCATEQWRRFAGQPATPSAAPGNGQVRERNARQKRRATGLGVARRAAGWFQSPSATATGA